MRRSGIIVLNVFAALWAILALISAHQPWWEMLFPAFLSIGVINWAIMRTTGDPAPDPAVRKRSVRLIAIASTVEGVLIVIAANIMINIGRPDLTIAAIAVVVGLHFWPLAWGLKVPLYWTTGLLLALVGIGGALGMTEPLRDVAIAFACAIILWLSACAVVLSPRKA